MKKEEICCCLEEFVRVQKDANSNLAFCVICNKTIIPKKQRLKPHEQTRDHYDKENAVFQSNLRTYDKFKQVGFRQVIMKRKELELAAMIACHESINGVGHIVSYVIRKGEGSHLQHLTLGRTKRVALIKRVISVATEDELKDDLKNVPYSLMCHESADTSCDKLLCVLVSFYNAGLEKIECKYSTSSFIRPSIIRLLD